MLTCIKKMFKREKGFTLVELLAVLAILGIIVAIAVPAIGNVIDDSEDDAKEANVELIENAARLADVNGESVDGMSVEDLVEDGYLEEIPEIPGSDDEEYSGTISKDEDGNITYEKGDDSEVPGNEN